MSANIHTSQPHQRHRTQRDSRSGYTVGSSPPSMTWLVPVR
jgi:hypothetical protein